MAEIRPARPEDEAALIEQFTGLNRYEQPFIGNRRLDEAGGEASLRHTEAWLERSGGVMFVAEREGRVVGHLAVGRERRPPFVREEWRDYAYVSELFLREEARGLGLGRALLEAAEAWARGQGLPTLVLSVLVGNDLAAGRYEAFGFRPTAMEMAKPLRGSGA